ncbi:hypothetical protein G6F65_021078 [Rhizopus arrhizus]|nr:hypothetical protein G6F65_021078 [Rhizopus arrhizus]
MGHLQGHAAFALVFAHGPRIALAAQFVGHILQRWPHHVADEAQHVGAARHHDHIAQAPFPGLAAARRPRQGQGLVADAALGRVQPQRLEQPPQRQQQDDGERQRACDGGRLQGGQSVGQQQCDGDSPHRQRPEDALPHRPPPSPPT